MTAPAPLPARLSDETWLVEGFIVGARAEHGRQIHAGVVHPITDGPFRSCYTMSPLCLRYRKRNGECLARHDRGHYPMLVGSTRRAFGDYVDMGDAWWGLPLCPYCVRVFKRERNAS